MRRAALLCLGLLVCLALPATAATHVDEDRDVGQEDRIERTFRLRESTPLRMTVSANPGQSGHLRVYIYQRSRQGGWSEIDDLRVVIRNHTDPTSGEFQLPEGTYKVVISARRMAYTVKIEDAEE